MYKIILLLFLIVLLGLFISALSADLLQSSNFQSSQGLKNNQSLSNPHNFQNSTCIGGACSIDMIKDNQIFNKDSKSDFAPQSNVYSQPTGATDSKGGLSSSPFVYDFNCQFGNCIGEPTGSYKP